jgi:hypothetical protein
MSLRLIVNVRKDFDQYAGILQKDCMKAYRSPKPTGAWPLTHAAKFAKILTTMRRYFAKNCTKI